MELKIQKPKPFYLPGKEPVWNPVNMNNGTLNSMLRYAMEDMRTYRGLFQNDREIPGDLNFNIGFYDALDSIDQTRRTRVTSNDIYENGSPIPLLTFNDFVPVKKPSIWQKIKKCYKIFVFKKK